MSECHLSPNYQKVFTHSIFLIIFLNANNINAFLKTTKAQTISQPVNVSGLEIAFVNISSPTPITELSVDFSDCFTLLILVILALLLFSVSKWMFTTIFCDTINNNIKTSVSGLLMTKLSWEYSRMFCMFYMQKHFCICLFFRCRQTFSFKNTNSWYIVTFIVNSCVKYIRFNVFDSSIKVSSN